MRFLMYLLSFLMVFSFTRCNPNPGDDTPPVSNILKISNPQVNYGTGTMGNWNSSNDADYKVKIKIQTLDANNNATVFKSYTHNKSFTNSSNAFESFNIEVPSQGAAFVIQVALEYSECTWQDATCTNGEGASKKDYFNQGTFSTSDHNFYINFTSNNIDYEECNCN